MRHSLGIAGRASSGCASSCNTMTAAAAAPGMRIAGGCSPCKRRRGSSEGSSQTAPGVALRATGCFTRFLRAGMSLRSPPRPTATQQPAPAGWACRGKAAAGQLSSLRATAGSRAQPASRRAPPAGGGCQGGGAQGGTRRAARGPGDLGDAAGGTTGGRCCRRPCAQVWGVALRTEAAAEAEEQVEWAAAGGVARESCC